MVHTPILTCRVIADHSGKEDITGRDQKAAVQGDWSCCIFIEQAEDKH